MLLLMFGPLLPRQRQPSSVAMAANRSTWAELGAPRCRFEELEVSNSGSSVFFAPDSPDWRVARFYWLPCDLSLSLTHSLARSPYPLLPLSSSLAPSPSSSLSPFSSLPPSFPHSPSSSPSLSPSSSLFPSSTLSLPPSLLSSPLSPSFALSLPPLSPSPN